MAIGDIPASISNASIIRIFVPGFIFSVLYSYAIIPNIANESLILISIENKIIIWIISGIVIGVIISSFDVQMYQLLEGISWPQHISAIKYKSTEANFKIIDSMLKSKKDKRNGEKDEGKIRELNNDISSLLNKIREYPYNPEKESFSRRYPQEATRFGNVLAEYENYSEVQYGMHMRVFWYHLWLLFPKDLQNDLDLRGATSDLPVYLSVNFLIFAFIGALGFVAQGKIFTALFCLCFSLLLSRLFYEAAISSHKIYGRYIKAAFDLYRIDLANKLNIPIGIIPNDKEKEKWQEYWYYLLEYIK